MLRAFLRFGLAVTIVLIVGVPSCVVWHSSDLPEVQDADLTIPPLVVEDEESNAYTNLERAAAALVWPSDEKCSLGGPLLGPGWNPRRAKQVIAANDEALAHLFRALEAPSFQVPRYDAFDEHDPLSPVISANLKLAHILAERAFLRAERGETRAALEDGLTVVHFGDRVQRADQSQLIHMMSGVGLKRHGFQILREIAAHAPVDAVLSREFEGRLSDYRTESETWSRAWAWEYQDLKGMWELLRADPLGQQLDSHFAADRTEEEDNSALVSLIPRAYVYHHNRSLTLWAEFIRSMQRDSSKPCAELKPPMEFVPGDGIDKLRTVLSRNSVGHILLAIATPNYRYLQFRRCESDTTLAATRAVLALEAYRYERGALPESLEELVPEFLSEVPRDGFDGKPLRYLPEHALIYSVGRDLVDGGGLVGVDERDLDEPVFRLGNPPNAVGEGAAG